MPFSKPIITANSYDDKSSPIQKKSYDLHNDDRTKEDDDSYDVDIVADVVDIEQHPAVSVSASTSTACKEEDDVDASKKCNDETYYKSNNNTNNNNKQSLNSIYLRWGIGCMAVLFMLVFPNVMYGIAHDGRYSLEINLNRKEPFMIPHIVSGLLGIILCVAQVVTGTTMNNNNNDPIINQNPPHRRGPTKNKRSSKKKKVHKVLGWMTLFVLVFLFLSGVVMNIKYWIRYKYLKSAPSTSAFGVVGFVMLVVAIYVVKFQYDTTLHKDIMISLFVYMLIGVGGVRWMSPIVSYFTDDCINVWHASMNYLVCYAVLYPTIWLSLFFRTYGKKLIFYYWRHILFLCVIPAIIPTIVGQTTIWMAYTGTEPYTCQTYGVASEP